jgi:hypothetical protein
MQAPTPPPKPFRLSWRFWLAMAALWLVLQLVLAAGALVGVLAAASGWICLSRLRAGTGTAWHLAGAIAAPVVLLLLVVAQLLPAFQGPAPSAATVAQPASRPGDPPAAPAAAASSTSSSSPVPPPPPGFKVLRQPTPVPDPPPGFELENPTPATTGCPIGYVPDGRYCVPASERDNSTTRAAPSRDFPDPVAMRSSRRAPPPAPTHPRYPPSDAGSSRTPPAAGMGSRSG